MKRLHTDPSRRTASMTLGATPARILAALTLVAAVHCTATGARAQTPCVSPDAGGTVALPALCDFLSVTGDWVVTDGLPPGDSLRFRPRLHSFFGITASPGGVLGGEVQQCQALLDLTVSGTGSFSTFSRFLSLPVSLELHSAPRTPGDPVQDFPHEIRVMGATLFGDPDFDQLAIRCGSLTGLPSPGHTTLTRLGPPGSDFNVDSFFDITYRIDYQGGPGSALDGLSGSQTDTSRIKQGDGAVEPLYFFGHAHQQLGDAQAVKQPDGSLRVSNLGSSGQDGVRISFGGEGSSGTGASEVEEFIVDVERWDPGEYSPSSSLRCEVESPFGGGPVSVCSEVEISPNLLSLQYEVTSSFAPVGASSLTLLAAVVHEEVARLEGWDGLTPVTCPVQPDRISAIGPRPTFFELDEIFDIPPTAFSQVWRLDWTDGPQQVILPGGIVALASSLYIFAEDPLTTESGPLASCSVFPPALVTGDPLIVSETFRDYGSSNLQLGDAIFEPSPSSGACIISNLGSSGQDGVRFVYRQEFGQVQQQRDSVVTFDPIVLDLSGSGLSFEGTCSTDDGTIHVFAWNQVTSPGGTVVPTADFTGAGASSVLFEFYLDNKFVDSLIVPNGGQAGEIVPGPTGLPELVGTELAIESSHPGAVFVYSRSCSFLTGGGTSITCDEIRMLARDIQPSQVPTEIISMDLRGSNLPPIKVVDKATPKLMAISPDDGTGSPEYPVISCPVTTADDPIVITNGLPLPGDTLEVRPFLRRMQRVSELPGTGCPLVETELTVEGLLVVTGTGSLSGIEERLEVTFDVTVTSPDLSSTAYQGKTFGHFTQMAWDNCRVTGHPLFDLLEIRVGDDPSSRPSVGRLDFRPLPGGDFQVDSFFDITYEIEFVGAPGSVLDGHSGVSGGRSSSEHGSGRPTGLRDPRGHRGMGHGISGQTRRRTSAVDPDVLILDHLSQTARDGIELFSGDAQASELDLHIGPAGSLSSGAEVRVCLDQRESCGYCATLRENGGGSAELVLEVGACKPDFVLVEIFSSGTLVDSRPYSLPLPSSLASGDMGSVGTEPMRLRAGDQDGVGGVCVDSFFDIFYAAPTTITLSGGAPLVCDQLRVSSVRCPSGSCSASSNAFGTVDLPAPCPWTAPEDPFFIIDGLPPGSQFSLTPTIDNHLLVSSTPGGTLGGEIVIFDSTLQLDVSGSGAFSGFARTLFCPVRLELHTAPRTPGDSVQTFDTTLFAMQGQLFGDPDFCLLRVTAGDSFGLPSPGHTTLTRLPGGSFNVDSFFDIVYRIDFQGCPGSPLDGLSGSTTGSSTVQQGADPIPPPTVCPSTEHTLSLTTGGSSSSPLDEISVGAPSLYMFGNRHSTLPSSSDSASISVYGATVQVSGLHADPDLGLQVDVSSAPLQVDLSVPRLLHDGQRIRVESTGTVCGETDHFISSGDVVCDGSVLRVSGDMSSTGATGLLVEVRDNGSPVSTFACPNGEFATLVSSSGISSPPVRGALFQSSLSSTACVLLFGEDFDLTPTTSPGPPVTGDEIRIFADSVSCPISHDRVVVRGENIGGFTVNNERTAPALTPPSAPPTPTPQATPTAPPVTATPSPAATPTPAAPTPTTMAPPTATSTPTPPFCCPGDANNSGSFVDANDFIAVQAHFGADNGVGGLGDANCSGSFVDANDFIAVQAAFGADCG